MRGTVLPLSRGHVAADIGDLQEGDFDLLWRHDEDAGQRIR